MPYPTNVNFQPVGQSLGIQPIGESSAIAQHPIGKTVPAKSVVYGEAEFVYLPGVAGTLAGDLVTYETDAATALTARSVVASRGPAAVAMSANTAGRFGWYAIQGVVPLNAASAGVGGAVFATATAGQAGSASGTLVDGARFVQALQVDNAMVSLASPSIPNPGGTGDATLAGNNAFTGNNAFSGANTSSGNLTFSGTGQIKPTFGTAGAPGDVTLNTQAGIAIIANTGTQVVVTNSLATATSGILATSMTAIVGNNQRPVYVTRAAGSFTLAVSGGATIADLPIAWMILNP